MSEKRRLNWAGLALALLLHVLILWGLWSYRVIPAPQDALTLLVDFIAPTPQAKVEEAVKAPPRKVQPVEKIPPRQLLAEAPATAPGDYLAPAPPPSPPIEMPATPQPQTPLSVTLDSELSVVCSERPPPVYPLSSRRMGEQGEVLLRVELDAKGAVSAAQIVSGSGFPRLDEAALATIRNWRCTPASRNGQPVRAIALQAFKFILQGK